MIRPTPIDVWAPAFRYFRKLTPANTLTDWGMCKACECPVNYSERTDHAARHDRELREWRKAQREVETA